MYIQLNPVHLTRIFDANIVCQMTHTLHIQYRWASAQQFSVGKGCPMRWNGITLMDTDFKWSRQHDKAFASTPGLWYQNANICNRYLAEYSIIYLGKYGVQKIAILVSNGRNDKYQEIGIFYAKRTYLHCSLMLLIFYYMTLKWQPQHFHKRICE